MYAMWGVPPHGRFEPSSAEGSQPAIALLLQRLRSSGYSTYGDAAWAYVKERTGTDLYGILTQLAAERSGRHE